jgi:hypothetical protein
VGRVHRWRDLWGLRPALRRAGPPPLKGLTDNPVYQWWRDPAIMQPDSWWCLARDEAALAEQVDLMREPGARLFRLELPWRALAPDRPGGSSYDAAAARDPAWPGYRWERFDLLLRLAEQAGIWLVPQVVFAPEWSSGVPATRHSGATAPPGAAAHVADLLTASASRYRGRVRYWELWNEPDHPHSWSGTLPQYVDLVLRPGAEAIRAADPDCRVLLGGLASHHNLAAIYEAGGGPCFDIASFHLYPTRPSAGQVRRAVRQVRAQLLARGDGHKPVWLTECGIATQPPSTPSPFGSATDEAGQARFLQALYRSVDAQAICWYQLRDTIIFDAAGQELKRVYWGLVSRDLARRKPSFAAYRRISSPRPADTAAPASRTPGDHPSAG